MTDDRVGVKVWVILLLWGSLGILSALLVPPVMPTFAETLLVVSVRSLSLMYMGLMIHWWCEPD